VKGPEMLNPSTADIIYRKRENNIQEIKQLLLFLGNIDIRTLNITERKSLLKEI
jgi:hypothetical protein